MSVDISEAVLIMKVEIEATSGGGGVNGAEFFSVCCCGGDQCWGMWLLKINIVCQSITVGEYS